MLLAVPKVRPDDAPASPRFQRSHRDAKSSCMNYQIIAAATAALIGAIPAFASPPDLPMNKPTTVNGIEVACTGVGSS